MENTELNKIRMVTFGAVLVSAIACVPIREPKPVGFLSTYENFRVVGEDRLFALART
jgi:hypothetical protein